MSEEKRLTIIEHLDELRQRLIKAVMGVVITTLFSFLFAKQIFLVLKSRAAGVDLIYTEVPEMLGTYMKVAFISGIALAMPLIIYQIVMFISPGLTPKEKRYLYALMPGIALCFFVGIAFGYFLVLPPALNFLLTFGGDIARPQIKVGNYVSVVTTLLFWIGLAFETPLVIFFLAWIRVVSPRMLSKYRKYAFLGAFVLGAAITPTFDPINQSLVAIPLVFLYELGILLARLAWRGRPA